MDIPQIQIAGLESLQGLQNAQNTQITETTDADMNSTQDPNAVNERKPATTQDIPLPEATIEPEPRPTEQPAPPKRNTGFQFLE
jgi:hypothetical protein